MHPNPPLPASVEWRVSHEWVDYPAAMAAMEERVASIIAGEAREMVWLLEHPPLYTSGTSASAADLLDHSRFPVYATGRGGQFTYHGPGQRVAYVMLDLKRRSLPAQPDIRAYVGKLEQWIIQTLAQFGVRGETRDGRIGVWVRAAGGQEAKIAALGIRVRKWVTYHGIAINVAPDLSHYAGIVPCGLSQFGMTSLKALGVEADMSAVDAALQSEFKNVFG